MAKTRLTDVYVSVNSVDLSDHAFSIDLPSEKERIDVSGFNSAGTKEYLAGNRDDSIVVQFLQDFSSSEVHQTLEPLYRNTTEFLIEIRPTSSAVSATNPKFSGSAYLLSYNGLSGELNSRSEITATFLPSNSTGFAWATV